MFLLPFSDSAESMPPLSMPYATSIIIYFQYCLSNGEIPQLSIKYSTNTHHEVSNCCKNIQTIRQHCDPFTALGSVREYFTFYQMGWVFLLTQRPEN